MPALGVDRCLRWPRAVACVVAVAVLAALVSCDSGGAKRSPVVSVAWERVPVADLPSTLADFEAVGMSGTRHGFVASGYTHRGQTMVVSSRDGRDWKYTEPYGINMLAAMSPIASDGTTTRLFGGAHRIPGTETAELPGDGPVPTLWKSTDDTSWSVEARFPAGPDTEIPLGVASGSRRTVVVMIVRTGLRGTGFDTARIRVRAGTDGKFTDVWDTPCAGTDETPPTAQVAATTDGFTLITRCGASAASRYGLFESRDGVSWRPAATPTGGNEFDAVAANAKTTVLAGVFADGVGTTRTQEPMTWSKSSDGAWSVSAPLDPGRIPDVGVAPRRDQRIDVVAGSKNGFAAIGRADVRGQQVPGVWFTPDGRTWTKQPIQANGFDTVASLDAVAVHGDTIALIGSGEPNSQVEGRETPARLWLGRIGGTPVTPAPTTFITWLAGPWNQSDGNAAAAITADGRLTFRFRLFSRCGPTEPPPCDSDTEPNGGLLTATLVSGPAPGEAHGVAGADSAGHDIRPGDSVLVRRTPYGGITISVREDSSSWGLERGVAEENAEDRS